MHELPCLTSNKTNSYVLHKKTKLLFCIVSMIFGEV